MILDAEARCAWCECRIHGDVLLDESGREFCPAPANCAQQFDNYEVWRLTEPKIPGA